MLFTEVKTANCTLSRKPQLELICWTIYISDSSRITQLDISLDMVKSSKRNPHKVKKKKAIQKSKGPKRPKKIGLAKYLPSQVKRKEPRDEDEVELESQHKQVPAVKKNQKNLNLLDRCKLQMSSSILRMIDEALYTSDTTNVPLDKEKFLAYHDAYASVCEKWPVKPIDYIVKFIKKRLLTKKRGHKYTFADIGCGREPLLKAKLPPKTKVISFDLVSAHKDVIEANMQEIPVQDETVDCAVYSLSLMASNLGNIILEGKRILKLGGSMVIVEVTSRFESNEKKFISKLERLGLKHKSSKALEPNGYFTFFHFTKTDSNQDYPNSCKNIQLKPCVYKSR